MRQNPASIIVRSPAASRGSFIVPQLLTALLHVSMALATGCISAVGVGVSLVGQVIDGADVKDHAKALVGNDIAAADERFGERLDTLREIDGPRVWHIYNVTHLNVLGKDRYVVEVRNNKIIALSRVETTSDAKTDIPRALVIASSVDGKSPNECESALDFGKPLLTARSDSTGLLSQIYDARILNELSRAHYCVLRFNVNEKCTKVEFIGVGASTEAAPM